MNFLKVVYQFIPLSTSSKTSTMRWKAGLCDGSTALEDITRSASLGSIYEMFESLSFSPFITF